MKLDKKGLILVENEIFNLCQKLVSERKVSLAEFVAGLGLSYAHHNNCICSSIDEARQAFESLTNNLDEEFKKCKEDQQKQMEKFDRSKNIFDSDGNEIGFQKGTK